MNFTSSTAHNRKAIYLGLPCHLQLCRATGGESFFMAENRKRKPPPSSRITSYFAKEQRKDGKYFFQWINTATFRDDFARAGGSE